MYVLVHIASVVLLMQLTGAQRSAVQAYNSRQQCGSRTIDTRHSICCEGLHYVRSGRQPACCGAIGYDAYSYFCCERTIQRKRNYKLPQCCGTRGYDGTVKQCVDGYLERRTNLGSTCCMVNQQWTCCERGENCCSGSGSRSNPRSSIEYRQGQGQNGGSRSRLPDIPAPRGSANQQSPIDIPGFRPACCRMPMLERSKCCASTMERTGSLPTCCNEEIVQPICCNRADGSLRCCPSALGYCCGMGDNEFNRRVAGLRDYDLPRSSRDQYGRLITQARDQYGRLITEAPRYGPSRNVRPTQPPRGVRPDSRPETRPGYRPLPHHPKPECCRGRGLKPQCCYAQVISQTCCSSTRTYYEQQQRSQQNQQQSSCCTQTRRTCCIGSQVSNRNNQRPPCCYSVSYHSRPACCSYQSYSSYSYGSCCSSDQSGSQEESRERLTCCEAPSLTQCCRETLIYAGRLAQCCSQLADRGTTRYTQLANRYTEPVNNPDADRETPPYQPDWERSSLSREFEQGGREPTIPITDRNYPIYSQTGRDNNQGSENLPSVPITDPNYPERPTGRGDNQGGSANIILNPDGGFNELDNEDKDGNYGYESREDVEKDDDPYNENQEYWASKTNPPRNEDVYYPTPKNDNNIWFPPASNEEEDRYSSQFTPYDRTKPKDGAGADDGGYVYQGPYQPDIDNGGNNAIDSNEEVIDEESGEEEQYDPYNKNIIIREKEPPKYVVPPGYEYAQLSTGDKGEYRYQGQGEDQGHVSGLPGRGVGDNQDYVNINHGMLPEDLFIEFGNPMMENEWEDEPVSLVLGEEDEKEEDNMDVDVSPQQSTRGPNEPIDTESNENENEAIENDAAAAILDNSEEGQGLGDWLDESFDNDDISSNGDDQDGDAILGPSSATPSRNASNGGIDTNETPGSAINENDGAGEAIEDQTIHTRFVEAPLNETLLYDPVSHLVYHTYYELTNDGWLEITQLRTPRPEEIQDLPLLPSFEKEYDTQEGNDGNHGDDQYPDVDEIQYGDGDYYDDYEDYYTSGNYFQYGGDPDYYYALEELCGGEVYDMSLYICCEGETRYRMGVEPRCCGNKAYDAFMYECCDPVNASIQRSCDEDYEPKKTSWGAFI